MTDTIFAISSGAFPAAIAIMRVSGPDAFVAARALAGKLPAPRRASLRRLRDPDSGETLDQAVVLLFPGPESATGEDIAEFHLHGGLAVTRAVDRALGTIPGCRQAEPGEFTRRALEAGRIDLTEAEGLADLLVAETESQRRAALRSTEGSLRRRIEDWTDQAIGLAAMIEVVIDHSDEDDAGDDAAITVAVRAGAAALAGDISQILAQPPAERLHDGVRVVFAGPPNSGKSTLFNKMAGREAAIVSPIAGTTRDRIEAPVVRDGVAWLLIDTAGLADATDDPIEAIGIERTREALASADVILWLGDDAPPHSVAELVPVHARADVPDRSELPAGRVAASGCVTDGDTAVWTRLVEIAAGMLPSGDLPLLNRRQRDLCRDAKESLCAAADENDTLIVAEELRRVREQFDRVTGRAHTEAVLDSLFGQFCIGK